MDPNQLLMMIQGLLPSLANNGQVGAKLNPQQQQIAAQKSDPTAQSGAVTPQDAATATVAGQMPNAPMDPSSAYLGGGANGNLARIAQQLVTGKGAQDPYVKEMRRQKAAFRPQGAPPMPISQPPFGKPPVPQQAASAPPQAVGAGAASPAGQQIIKALLAQMGRGVSASG